MKGDNILYETLYQSILTQLYSGIIRCGQSFPSQKELCQQYNAGITTVRRVIRMLETEGYLHTAPGKRAVVRFDGTDEAYVSALLQRRESILDIYGGLGLIMPPLYAEGAKHADETALHAVIDAIRNAADPAEIHQHAVRFFTELLLPYRNPVVLDLQSDMEHFARIPYLPSSGLRSPLSTTGRAAAYLQAVLHLAEQEDSPALLMQLEQMYRDAAVRTGAYLDGLCKRYPGERPAVYFQWFCNKGRVPLYTVVARSLYKRMEDGEFDTCTYLPSVPDLMKTYEISKSTACSAVALLSDIGAVSVLDKKGIKRRTGEPLSPIRLELPVIHEHLILFLNVMQILTVCAKRLAFAACSALDAGQAQALAAAWSAPDPRCSPRIVQALLEFLGQHVPYRCLRAILKQFDDILIWGHYLHRLQPLGAEREDLERQIGSLHTSLCAALRCGETERFAACFQAVFQAAYRLCRAQLQRCTQTAAQFPANIM